MAGAGDIVAWWDGSRLSTGMVAAGEKGRLRLILAGGSEQRVSPSRVPFVLERATSAPGRSLEERREAGRKVEAADRRMREAASAVEVPLLWELARECGDDAEDGWLAELALGSRGDEARAALTLALLEDGTHFVRRGTLWRPRTAEAVEEIRLQRERDRQSAAERAAARERIVAAARGGASVLADTRPERRYLQALEEVAVRGVAAADEARSLAAEILEAWGEPHERAEEGAFRILRRVGRFASDDENLQILRFGLRTSFAPEMLEDATAVVSRAYDRSARADLTGLDVVTVDGARTREIDDGLSAEPLPGGAVRVGVHIADPGCYVAPGGRIDDEARARTASYYLPEMRLPMLPPAICEDAASLVEGEERPALSFLVDLDAAGEVADLTISRSIVRSRARLDYEEADRFLREGSGPWASLLGGLAAAARLRERARARAGAVRIVAPEVDVYVDESGSVVLERIDRHSPSRAMVAEAMILAGALAARFCLDRTVPVIYRRQPPPAEPPVVPPGGLEDPVEVRAARRRLRRAEVGLEPGPHFGLGLDAYVQVTSPLRRFQDLVTQRQIVAVLEGSGPVYDRAEVQRIAASTEEGERDGRRAEAASNRYWLLRHLEASVGEEIEAVVVDLEPRPVVQLEETLLEHPVPGLEGADLGQRVRLRVDKVNARADLLVLRA